MRRLESTSPGFEQRLSVVAANGHAPLRPVHQGAAALAPALLGDGAVPVTRIRDDGTTLKASLPQLPRGGYTIRWHALSGDGHVVSGVFTFGVRARAPAPTDAFGASGPTRTEDVVRWLYFLSLALLVGGLGFRLLVARRPLPARFFV